MAKVIQWNDDKHPWDTPCSFEFREWLQANPAEDGPMKDEYQCELLRRLVEYAWNNIEDVVAEWYADDVDGADDKECRVRSRISTLIEELYQ